MRPGLYEGVDETAYHTRTWGPRESLSSTEARTLLECPALLHYQRAHSTPPTTAMDVGTIAHHLVLGTGSEVEVVDAPDWRTKATREHRDQARAEGRVPLLRSQWDVAVAMADAVMTHPVAGALLEQGAGEVSVIARDQDTGVWMRGRLDWWDEARALAVDLKTTTALSEADLARHVATMGIDLQMEWYRHAVAQATGELIDMLHVVVDRNPPHLVRVVHLDEGFAATGRARTLRALQVYADCLESGTWPGFEDTGYIKAPSWYVRNVLG